MLESVIKVYVKSEENSSTSQDNVFYGRRPQKIQKEVRKHLQNTGVSWSWTKPQNHALACTGVHFSRFQPLKNHTFFGLFFDARFESSRNYVFSSFCIKKSSQRVPKISKKLFENRVKKEPLKINLFT